MKIGSSIPLRRCSQKVRFLGWFSYFWLLLLLNNPCGPLQRNFNLNSVKIEILYKPENPHLLILTSSSWSLLSFIAAVGLPRLPSPNENLELTDQIISVYIYTNRSFLPLRSYVENIFIIFSLHIHTR